MRIALVAGHDKFRMKGAVGRSRLLGKSISENEFWNDFIKELFPKLNIYKNLEFKQFHRPNQKSIGYNESMRQQHGEIDKWGADLDLEFHFNAGGVNATGHEVLHYTGSKRSEEYANLLDKSFDKYLQNKDRNRKPTPKGERGSYGLYVGKSASLITEAFFNVEIDDFLPNGKQRENLFKAYLDFFEVLDKR